MAVNIIDNPNFPVDFCTDKYSHSQYLAMVSDACEKLERIGQNIPGRINPARIIANLVCCVATSTGGRRGRVVYQIPVRVVRQNVRFTMNAETQRVFSMKDDREQYYICSYTV